jgi:hypothetical protein
MIRGRGALTFRIGNFFSGVDQEQMRLTETGDLGIGTSQPQAKLDVAGTVRAQRFLVVKPNLGNGDKTAAATQATDGADGVQPLVAGTGTQNQIAKWTDNAGTLGDSGITETAGGNIGIGTPSPATKLDVAGTTQTRTLGVNNGSYAGNIVWGNNGFADWYMSGAGASSSIRFRTWDGAGYSDKVTFQNGGNVGIGTASPVTKLDVAGSTQTQNLFLNSGSYAGSLTWGNNSFAQWYMTGAGASSSIRFRTWDGAGYSDKVTFQNDGNVGIGTAAPVEKLTVQTAKGFYGFTHLATDANGANPIALSTYVGSSASGAIGGWLGTKTNHDLHFFTNGGQPSMTIIVSGNVGIGTSTPTNKLHVENTGSGSVAVYGNVTNSGTGVWGNNTNNGTGVYGSSGNGIGIAGESNGIGVRGKSISGYAGYFEGKAYVGGSLEVFGNICAANFMCQSDARLKQDVTNLKYGVRHLLQLRPVSWRWKDPKQRQPTLGLVAQEVEPVMPELVLHGTDAKDSLGLNYLGLIPVLVKGIQEQQEQIDALRKVNDSLNARLQLIERLKNKRGSTRQRR